jgi:hypothetical protein
MIALLRERGIVRGERGTVYRYRLAPDAYSQHVRLSLVNPHEKL